ncbi:MAG: carbohydrate porin [Candidatus Rokubacteria bacterium]|jgi:hypothetical protein|nr:carbohydrate porin [Candidatus Rokubacteria bacterium]
MRACPGAIIRAGTTTRTSTPLSPIPAGSRRGTTASSCWASRWSTGKAYYGGFSRDLPGQTYELVLEWTYAIAVARWLTVQPDLQYVINPGGRSSVGSAVVLGAQLAVEF